MTWLGATRRRTSAPYSRGGVQRSRTFWVGVLLILSFLPVGILAYQTHQLSLSQQLTARQVLEDYAEISAQAFSARLGETLVYRSVLW